jgi:hypothetical protein
MMWRRSAKHAGLNARIRTEGNQNFEPGFSATRSAARPRSTELERSVLAEGGVVLRWWLLLVIGAGPVELSIATAMASGPAGNCQATLSQSITTTTPVGSPSASHRSFGSSVDVNPRFRGA